jgi:hypothetical protein
MNLEDIGLAFALLKLNLNVSMKRSTSAYGFQVRRALYFKSNCTEEQQKCIEVWAQSKGLTILGRTEIGNQKEITMWMDALEPYEPLMDNSMKRNIRKVRWTYENPIPKTLWRDDGTRRKVKTGRNWKKFMYWAEAWDAFNDALDEEFP